MRQFVFGRSCCFPDNVDYVRYSLALLHLAFAVSAQVHDVGPMVGAGVRRPLADTEFEGEGGEKPRVGLAWVLGGGRYFRTRGTLLEVGSRRS